MSLSNNSLRKLYIVYHTLCPIVAHIIRYVLDRRHVITQTVYELRFCMHSNRRNGSVECVFVCHYQHIYKSPDCVLFRQPWGRYPAQLTIEMFIYKTLDNMHNDEFTGVHLSHIYWVSSMTYCQHSQANSSENQVCLFADGQRNNYWFILQVKQKESAFVKERRVTGPKQTLPNADPHIQITYSRM